MDKILDFSKKVIKEKLNHTSIGVDCTLGRGNDALFLSSICDNVYAFEIQDEAINYSKELFKKENINNIKIIKDGHENISNYLERANVFMFNLGYLPKGDKSVTTKTQTTLKALESALSILEVNGLISIICYPGCPSGLDESIEISKYLKDLDQKRYDIIKYEFVNQINNPPFCYIIERIR